MPLHSFRCPKGHTAEVMFLTFKAAEGVYERPCTQCKATARRLEFEVPYPALLYGSGFHRPSPTKRDSYKHISKDFGNRTMYATDRSA